MAAEETLGRWLPVRAQHWLRDSPRFVRLLNGATLAAAAPALLARRPAHAAAFLSRRGVAEEAYGPSARHRMEVFPGPELCCRTVLFVHGGAWGLGEKTLYRLHGRELQRRGYTACVLNYRTYPFVGSEEQASDVLLALRWVRYNAQRRPELHMDAERVVMLAHSSGAHITMLGALRALGAASTDAVAVAQEVDTPLCQGLVLLAGVYCPEQHYNFEVGRGVHEMSYMKPANSVRGVGPGLDDRTRAMMRARSPLRILEELAAGRSEEQRKSLARRLPPVLLVHGALDKTVPPSSSLNMHDQLERTIAARSRCVLLEDHDHVSLVLDFLLGKPEGEAVMDLLDRFSTDANRRPRAFSRL